MARLVVTFRDGNGNLVLATPAQQLSTGATRWVNLGDRVVGAAMWLRRNPMYLAGGLLLLVAFKPRKSLRALGRVWSLWRSWQGARRWIAQAR